MIVILHMRASFKLHILDMQAAEGPRASDRFAAVAAAFVSSLSGRAGAPDIGANFAAALAARLEAAYAREDSLSCGNLAGVFAQMYLTGLLPAGCVYSLLEHLRTRFEEQDVALLHLLLKLCGFRLRSDDPEAMKVGHYPERRLCCLHHSLDQ